MLSAIIPGGLLITAQPPSVFCLVLMISGIVNKRHNGVNLGAQLNQQHLHIGTIQPIVDECCFTFIGHMLL